GLRAASLLYAMLRLGARPCQALAKPPLIVNIMAHDTSQEPLRSLLEELRAAEDRHGLFASLLPGFAYADVPQMGPSLLRVTDGDMDLARREADRLAARLWEVREQLTPTLPDAAAAVQQALRAERRPVVLVDTGDNVGGGSAGDGTVVLAEMLRQGVTAGV